MIVEIHLSELLADKMAREKRAISMAEVARQTNMTRQNVAKWFNNRVKCPPLQTIGVLCQYFECKPGDLIVMREGQAS